MSFFSQFPTTTYDANMDGTLDEVTDIFRYVDVEDRRIDNLITYSFYEILDGERPDIVSQKLYGSPNYYWTFFVINDTLKHGLEDWPKSAQEMDDFLLENFDKTYSVVKLKPKFEKSITFTSFDDIDSQGGPSADGKYIHEPDIFLDSLRKNPTIFTGTIKQKDVENNVYFNNRQVLAGIPINDELFVRNYKTGEIARPLFYDVETGSLSIVKKTISKINIVNGSTGYVRAPKVTIGKSETGQSATALAAIGLTGEIELVELTSVGGGYSSVPAVTVEDGPTRIATVLPSVSTTGLLTSFDLRDAGLGYCKKPKLKVLSPPGITPTSTLLEPSFELDLITGGIINFVSPAVYEYDVTVKLYGSRFSFLLDLPYDELNTITVSGTGSTLVKVVDIIQGGGDSQDTNLYTIVDLFVPDSVDVEDLTFGYTVLDYTDFGILSEDTADFFQVNSILYDSSDAEYLIVSSNRVDESTFNLRLRASDVETLQTGVSVYGITQLEIDSQLTEPYRSQALSPKILSNSFDIRYTSTVPVVYFENDSSNKPVLEAIIVDDEFICKLQSMSFVFQKETAERTIETHVPFRVDNYGYISLGDPGEYTIVDLNDSQGVWTSGQDSGIGVFLKPSSKSPSIFSATNTGGTNPYSSSGTALEESFDSYFTTWKINVSGSASFRGKHWIVGSPDTLVADYSAKSVVDANYKYRWRFSKNENGDTASPIQEVNIPSIHNSLWYDVENTMPTKKDTSWEIFNNTWFEDGSVNTSSDNSYSEYRFYPSSNPISPWHERPNFIKKLLPLLTGEDWTIPAANGGIGISEGIDPSDGRPFIEITDISIPSNGYVPLQRYYTSFNEITGEQKLVINFSRLGFTIADLSDRYEYSASISITISITPEDLTPIGDNLNLSSIKGWGEAASYNLFNGFNNGNSSDLFAVGTSGSVYLNGISFLTTRGYNSIPLYNISVEEQTYLPLTHLSYTVSPTGSNRISVSVRGKKYTVYEALFTLKNSGETQSQQFVIKFDTGLSGYASQFKDTYVVIPEGETAVLTFEKLISEKTYEKQITTQYTKVFLQWIRATWPTLYWDGIANSKVNGVFSEALFYDYIEKNLVVPVEQLCSTFSNTTNNLVNENDEEVSELDVIIQNENLSLGGEPISRDEYLSKEREKYKEIVASSSTVSSNGTMYVNYPSHLYETYVTENMIPVTLAEKYINENEGKRKIRVVRPERIREFVSRYRTLLNTDEFQLTE